MRRIAEVFSDYFELWEIRLPQEAINNRQRGEMRACGWHIQYLFGCDDQGEYLDFYATHRMTNDRHVRIYACGEVVSLLAYEEAMIFPAGASQAERQRLEAEYLAHNQRVAELLKEKGFA